MLLARGPGAPEGDLDDRVEMQLCLTPQGQIDQMAYAAAPEPWLSRRKRRGATTRQSEVIRLDEGWALQSMRSEDDPLWTLEGHVFRPGELVRLGRPDGEGLLYRIVAVEAA